MLTIRSATSDDSSIISELGRTTFVETFENLFVNRADDLAAYLDATFTSTKIAAGLAKSGNRFWLAEWNRLPIGYAKLKLGSGHSAIDGRTVAQLQKIYVLRTHLSCGAGRDLQQAVLNCARDARSDQIWLTVLESNRRAIEFYFKHGWKFAGKDRHRIGSQTFTYDVLSLSL